MARPEEIARTLIDHVITRRSRQLRTNTTACDSTGAHVEAEFRASEVGDLPAAKRNIPTASGPIPPWGGGARALSMTKAELYHNLMRIRSAQPASPAEAQVFSQPFHLQRQGYSGPTAKPTSHADARPEERERRSKEMASTGEGLTGLLHDGENQRLQPGGSRGRSERGGCTGPWLEPRVLEPRSPRLDKPLLEDRGRFEVAPKSESELKGAIAVRGNSLWDVEPDVNEIGFGEGFVGNKMPVLLQWDGEGEGYTRARQLPLLVFH